MRAVIDETMMRGGLAELCFRMSPTNGEKNSFVCFNWKKPSKQIGKISLIEERIFLPNSRNALQLNRVYVHTNRCRLMNLRLVLR